jgi:hypothetical protein
VLEVNELLSSDDFKPVTLADRPLFGHHYARFPQVHSDNTFSNMVCWNHYAHYKFAFTRHNLILSSTIDGRTKFRPPIGPRDETLLKDLIALAVQMGDDAPLTLIDGETAKWISVEYPVLPLFPDRDYYEYIYRSADLAHLPGKKYLTIRHQLNKFRRTCNPRIEKISRQTVDEVRQFLIEWCEWKHCEGEPVLSHEKDAIFFAIEHLEEIGLSGIIIRVNGKVGAISLFEPLNPSTILVHFEKGLPECEGMYKAINAELALTVENRFEFINRESDLGIQGLRDAKMRYHPHHLLEVFYARSKDLEELV